MTNEEAWKLYWLRFDWNALLDGTCVPGPWENCCDERGKSFPCLGETTSRVAGVKPPCGCKAATNIFDVAVAAVPNMADDAVLTLIDKLKTP